MLRIKMNCRGYTIKDFDWKYYLNNNKDLGEAGLVSRRDAWVHWCKFGHKEERVNRILSSSEELVLYDLNHIIKKYNINQIYVSMSLLHLKTRIMKMYNLQNYTNINKPCIFFGIYNYKDEIEKIKKHKSISFIMPGGSDCVNFRYIKNKSIYISISRNIYDRILSFKIPSILTYLNLVDTRLFKPITVKGDKIFIYNGIRKKTDNDIIYGKKYYEEVVRQLPNYEYIYSSDLNVPYERMPEIYSKCFIGIRLTEHDGNANMVQEMEVMGIPVVHNHSDYGLKWKQISDIIGYVNKYSIKYRQIQNTKKYNFYNIKTLNDEILKNIYKNIDEFDDFIKSYNNILFICGDYPGYGGAATNCYKLQQYYNELGHNTYVFYYNFEGDINKKYEINKNYMIGDLSKINSIDFNPDIIILKSFVGLNLKKLFNCPVIYLIGGIYKNTLDKYYYNIYTKEEQDKYINSHVLNQIHKSDYIFVNSSHTQDILKTIYHIDTNLFYSSFISFKNKDIVIDNKFNERKYEYGFIVSNFDRKIKNVKKIINLLKKEENVILIGKGSIKYLSHGFTCIELVDLNEMEKYYKQIKYIVQDSFYESCSNVIIECLFNGCKIYNPIIKLKSYETYSLKKNTYYVINSTTETYNNINVYDLFEYNKFNGYFMDHSSYKSIGIYILIDKDIILDYNTILSNITIHNKIIGFNDNTYNETEIINMYYLYGKYNISIDLLGLSLFYDSYMNENRKYNRMLYILIKSYYYGKNNIDNYLVSINNKLKQDIFHKKDVLIISKLQSGYGGVQKTTTQILLNIDRKYNIRFISNKLRKSIKYDYEYNRLNNNIPNCIIIKISNLNDITDYINKNNFEFIINNKLNELLNCPIKKKIHFICHNSMDPVNSIILKNESKIDTMFTINNFHKKLLLHENYSSKITLYKNYISNISVLYNNRYEFNYNIAFIGRLTKEKNVQSLIDGVNLYNNLNNNKLNLYIIGDGNIKLKNLNNRHILLGKVDFSRICEIFKIIDYVISASITEGKPFSIIEAQYFGIPGIHSNINGINEIIYNKTNGFLFELENYDDIKYDLHFNNLSKIQNIRCSNNILKVLKDAYSININQWNIMSDKCLKYSKKKYCSTYCNTYSMNHFEKNILKVHKKKKIFVNFKPNVSIPYGGGNISVFYIIECLTQYYSDFEVTFELENDINIYLIIDPFKGRGGFKKYSLNDVINHRLNNNHSGKIIIRINDCDKTRIIVDKSKSREQEIMKHYKNIDYFIFNSHFIKDYYIKQFKINDITLNSNYSVIVNGCDQTIFKNLNKKINDKIKIVTHHWSDNMFKGYETYYNLWEYTKNTKTNIEFTFIGKNVPKMFSKVPIIGPFIKDEISIELNKYHMYITDSQYDSCPNHVLEAISCGLPILYSNKEGGSKELSTMSPYKIGEMYNSMDELIEKINIIKNNYDFYKKNIEKSLYIFDINYSTSKYYNLFLRNIAVYNEIKLTHTNNIINIDNKENGYILLDNSYIKLTKGRTILAINNQTYKSIKIINSSYNVENFNHFTKLNNNKINVLLCSDSNYYVGVFANLNSLIENTDYLNEIHFNFILPIETTNIFAKMLEEFELKLNIILDKTFIYIDKYILHPIIFKSKCYNGGGHLLNIGNFSRLLIGEFMEYEKLLYLDSDSIVQNDIIEKILYFDLKYDLYSACANKINKIREKQIVIKMSAIINCDYDWTSFIGKPINKDNYVFMGAPFLTNCKKWKNIYKDIIKLIRIHNNHENGVYKLFTMSIQNILFYDKIGNIGDVLNVLQDLGSMRKKWDKSDLIDKDILDWSGIYKPWYKNGLYRKWWLYYDIMKLSDKYDYEINSVKNSIETFKFIKNNVDFSHLNISQTMFDKFQTYINNITPIKKSYKYNILYVIDTNYLCKKMSRVRFWAIEELGKHENINLILTGPGFLNFNKNYSLQTNILNLNIKFDLVLWYKPLNYNFDKKNKLPFKTCLRYNEMWDEQFTRNEIDETDTDLIICHHKNDYYKYTQLYKYSKKEFKYIPHFANPTIFKHLNKNRTIDIFLSGVIKEKHYPLKYRMYNLIMKHKKTTFKKYNIYHHNHPSYNHNNSFENENQIYYNNLINVSKLCIACTSRYNYRLGKYVEIPMAGGVIVGDIPFEDSSFKDFVVEINNSMSDDDILNIIKNTLENPTYIKEKQTIGLKWASKYTTSTYIDTLLKTFFSKKIYIISDEIHDNHPEFKNQKWICDQLKNEFIESYPYETTYYAKNADIIWYLAPWNYKYTPPGFKYNEWLCFLKTKQVISTQHHIDPDKIDQLQRQFEFMKKYSTHIHSICKRTENVLKLYFNKVINKNLWINDNIYYFMNNKDKLRQKYQFNKNSFLIGSFQKDTEGKTNLPKLSKGPDIFINIVKDMYKTNKNIEIVLTGLRRDYIIDKLNDSGIKYHYFNMVDSNIINELYNCLDLYIISSRCEGGPRSVFEAGLTKTPIISTRVGISDELMNEKSIYDYNNWLSYKDAIPDTIFLYNSIQQLLLTNYLDEFKKDVFPFN